MATVTFSNPDANTSETLDANGNITVSGTIASAFGESQLLSTSEIRVFMYLVDDDSGEYAHYKDDITPSGTTWSTSFGSLTTHENEYCNFVAVAYDSSGNALGAAAIGDVLLLPYTSKKEETT